jgi:hypothetical protein
MKNKYSDMIERCGIEKLHNNFKVYGCILEHINGIIMFIKGS